MLYPRGNGPQYPLMRRMGEPWLFGEEKNFLSLLIIEP